VSEPRFPGVSFTTFAALRSAISSRAGVPRSWAIKLTGHKTESVYRRYAIVSEANLTEGVRP